MARPLDEVGILDTDPVTGVPNANPIRACKRRLQSLAAAGFVWPTAFDDGGKQRDVALLGPASAGVTGTSPARNRIPPRKRAHHVRTLDAVALIQRDVGASGGRLRRTRMEAELRLERQRGRFTRRGDELDLVPDAACTIEGDGRSVEVAIEYVTSKYTDDDIARKRDAFADSYDRVMWFADRPRTAERVRKMTGMPCTILK
jgi:hypothetical protein